MRIEVSRSGGVAGMTRRGVVETEAAADPAGWQELVRAALPPDPPPPADPAVRDGFTWSISIVTTHVESAAPDTTHVELGDTQLAGPLRTLAERALREGAPRRS
ncbi:hypothetical protein GCM10027047_09860 [Rhodococcus aerolatus]